MLDDDDAVPPPIRRSPRAALEHQTARDRVLIDEDDEFDQAAPIVPRSRSASLKSTSSLQKKTPPVNPLAAHPITPEKVTNFSRHRFSHPFRDELESIQKVEPTPPPPKAPPVPPVPRRSPARLKSYRTNKRLPLHLRRRTSLETIDSVTTTHSLDPEEEEDEPDPPEADAPSPNLFTLEHDPNSTPMTCGTRSLASDTRSQASSIQSSSINSQHSSYIGITPTVSLEAEPSSPKALFRKMKHRKPNATAVPDRLVIERKVSLDQTSHRSSRSESCQSQPSERPNASGLFDGERSQSGSSSEWSASSFDATGLSEAELKKCKKKGINPSLYAEMKAARKGKWTSPIAGNTFL